MLKGKMIFGDDDIDEDLLEAKELDRKFKNLISKKHCELLREYLKESEDANPEDSKCIEKIFKKSKIYRSSN